MISVPRAVATGAWEPSRLGRSAPRPAGSRRDGTSTRIPASWLFTCLLACLLGCGGATGGPPAGEEASSQPSSCWSLLEEHAEIPGIHSQGLASLSESVPLQMVFSSRFTIDRTRDHTLLEFQPAISRDLAFRGFDHLGDPDAWGGHVFGPMEDLDGPEPPYHRAFSVYDAVSLKVIEWAEDPGDPDRPEDGDAAWASVSPDGQWLLTSPWDPQESLIVYAIKDLASGNTIQERAEIPLDAVLARVQGCDFDGPRVLLCASDDKDTGRMLYRIVLSGALGGPRFPSGLQGHVEALFPVPLPPGLCGEEPEVEGVDVNGDYLRVLVIGTCLIDTYLYTFERCADPG